MTHRIALTASLALVLGLLVVPTADAQPYGAWLILESDDPGYIEVPHDPELNVSDEITLEAWVSIDGENCDSLVGKNWTQAYWLGSCDGELRSYLRSDTSSRTAGTIPPGEWTHVAMTFDGAERRHYINGELVASWSETEALGESTSDLRIGSDVEWELTPDGAIDNVRLWSVARSMEQIRQDLNEELPADTTGLVAVWNMGTGADDFNGHDGSLVGNTAALTFPVAAGCSATDTSLCLADRFSARVEWRTEDDATGVGSVVPCGSADTGLFWFFNEANVELTVKVLDGCGVNGHHWVFVASGSTVEYEITVTDTLHDETRTYGNELGETHSLIANTNAFTTRP